MPYLNLDPNYFDHPKTRRLVGILGPMADVLPVRLWAYCAKIHPVDGRLRGYSAEEIEGIIGWIGAPKVAIAALARVGYILESQEGFSCVDWRQHEGHLAAFSRRGKIAAKARWAQYASSMPEAMPKPCKSNAPAVPHQPTKPQQINRTAAPSDFSAYRLNIGEFKGVYVTSLPLETAEQFLKTARPGGIEKKAVEWWIAQKRGELIPGGKQK